MGFPIETNVLVMEGGVPQWKHMKDVATSDFLFDGEKWLPAGRLMYFPVAPVTEVMGVAATADVTVWAPKQWTLWGNFWDDLSFRLDAVHWTKHLLDEWPKPLYIKPKGYTPVLTYTFMNRKFLVRTNIGPIMVRA